MNSKAKMRNLNFKVDQEFKEKLEKLSQRLKISQSSVIRLAVILLEKKLDGGKNV